jgi:hypothetical protein
VDDYGISREGYGEPQVMNNWRVQYASANAAERISFYIPESVQVVYPLLIEDKQVYDESGAVSGLSIMVDARSKKVSNVYDLTTKQFERSEYTGETDGKRILGIAENGGFRNYTYAEPAASEKIKTTQLNLDTPTLQLVRIWYSADNYKTNNELYVPALVFPIKDWEKTGYWRQNVIVPVVREILDSDKQPPIMPLDEPISVPPASKPEPTPKPIEPAPSASAPIGF